MEELLSFEKLCFPRDLKSLASLCRFTYCRMYVGSCRQKPADLVIAQRGCGGQNIAQSWSTSALKVVTSFDLQAHAANYSKEDWDDEDIFVNHDKAQFLLVRGNPLQQHI